MKTRLFTLLALSALAVPAFAQVTQIKQTAAGLTIGTRAAGKIGFYATAPALRPTTSALTENSSSIGGTNDGNLPSLTATAATVTGTLTGTANGGVVDIAATAASTAGGAEPSAAQVDAGIATAVASIVTGTNEQLKELQTQLNAVIADNVALRAAIRENATAINALRSALVTLGLTATP